MLLSGRVEGIFLILQLSLQTCQNLEVGRQLGRQLAYVLSLKLANLLLLVRENFPGGFEPALEKLCRVFRLLLAHFEILADEQVGQFAGHILGNLRIVRQVIDIKRTDPILGIAHSSISMSLRMCSTFSSGVR